MSTSLKPILDYLYNCGFLKTSSSIFDGLHFGPLGVILANNIKKEYINSNVRKTDFPTYYYEGHPKNLWQEGKLSFLICNSHIT